MENDEGTEYRAKIDRPESSIKKTVVDEFASNYEEVKKFDGLDNNFKRKAATIFIIIILPPWHNMLSHNKKHPSRP